MLPPVFKREWKVPEQNQLSYYNNPTEQLCAFQKWVISCRQPWMDKLTTAEILVREELKKYVGLVLKVLKPIVSRESFWNHGFKKCKCKHWWEQSYIWCQPVDYIWGNICFLGVPKKSSQFPRHSCSWKWVSEGEKKSTFLKFVWIIRTQNVQQPSKTIQNGRNGTKPKISDKILFRCASISWFQVVRKSVSDVFRLAHLRVFQGYF